MNESQVAIGSQLYLQIELLNVNILLFSSLIIQSSSVLSLSQKLILPICAANSSIKYC